MRTPNSKECAYGGYKLSSICTDIECFDVDGIPALQVVIGCDEDDTFYSDSDKQGRVTIEIELEDNLITLDLEDVLVFAKKYCSTMYSRINNDAQSLSTQHYNSVDN